MRARNILAAAAALAAGMAWGAWAGEEASLEACLARALENNLDLSIQRLSRKEAGMDREIARGGYDPELSLTAQRRHEETKGKSAGTAAGALETVESDSDEDSFAASVGGLLPGVGTRYEVTAREGTSEGTRGGNPFDTSTAGVGASVTQPLLKGFKTDETRWRVATAELGDQAAALALERQAQELAGKVERAWYALVQARADIEVQQEGVRLAEQLLEDNRRKVKIGALSPLDEKQAESQAASMRAALAGARQAEREAENALKHLVSPDWRSVREERLETGEDWRAAREEVDAGRALERALERRPDVRKARLEVESQELAAAFYRNQRLPSLNVVGGAGLAASGEDSRGDAWQTVGDADEPYWTLGVTFSMPLGNRAAKGRHRQALAAAERKALEARRAEEEALLEVDNALAALETGWERVESTRDAREYAEQALEAEQAKLDRGRSTSFVVLEMQKNLTAARKDEIAASTGYRLCLSVLALAEGTIFDRHGIEWGGGE